jgi:hypothetical protein
LSGPAETEGFWLAELDHLDTEQNRTACMAGKIEDWATESLLAARAAYLMLGTDLRPKRGQKLTEEYYNTNLPVARQQLAKRAWGLPECSMRCLRRIEGQITLQNQGRIKPESVMRGSSGLFG